MLTESQFAELYPNCKISNDLIKSMKKLFEPNKINNAKRIASFIAQCAHESGGFRVFSENLNYSASGLDLTFPKYFKDAGIDSKKYAKNPEKIANRVYASRMGNSDESSGDGYKYRGRGPIQITGKSNYTALSKSINIDLISNPDLICTDTDIMIKSAIWFWNANDLNSFADKEDLKGMTRKINGGYIGLDDRIEQYNKIVKLLKENS